MAKTLREWVRTDVQRVKHKPLKWISEQHFFRDPSRPMFSDMNYFFAPADGIILYQQEVEPTECIVDIKGKPYSLRAAMQDDSFDKKCLVIGIFMTMYDVHINRVPYPGFLSYKQLDLISTFNYPMLGVERGLIGDLRVDHSEADYLPSNQRVLNRVFSPGLQESYYVLQIADYDVDNITPFNLSQNAPVSQNQRFSQIRFGSQVDLSVPLSDRYRLEIMQETSSHVEGGLDPLIRIIRKAQI